jgi:hypothetical protein
LRFADNSAEQVKSRVKDQGDNQKSKVLKSFMESADNGEVTIKLPEYMLGSDILPQFS